MVCFFFFHAFTEQSPSSESNRESPFPAVNDNMYETELLAAECVMRHSTTMDQKNVEGIFTMT